jgi:hypothetical protein
VPIPQGQVQDDLGRDRDERNGDQAGARPDVGERQLPELNDAAQ